MKIETDTFSSSDPKVHARNIGGMLDKLVNHLREDIAKVTEPKAQALFETTAEVLIGLRTAYEHYQSGTEAALVEPKLAQRERR